MVLLQGVKAAEEAATQAAAAAQAAESGGNAVETTSKAALAALRCSQVAALIINDMLLSSLSFTEEALKQRWACSKQLNVWI